MHLVSAFPGAFPHTHIVCRPIMHLAGELIQQYNVFQTKCTLFPPGQLNWNKSLQKHWPEAKHFASWKDVWWLPLWAPPQPPWSCGMGSSSLLSCPLLVCSGFADCSRARTNCDGVFHAVLYSLPQPLEGVTPRMKPLLDQVVSMLSRECCCSHRAKTMEWCWACFLQAVLSLGNLNPKLLGTGDVCQSFFMVPDLWAGGLYLAEKQGHSKSCFRANKNIVGRGLAGVSWIGRRRPCSQACDLSSFQSFLWWARAEPAPVGVPQKPLQGVAPGECQGALLTFHCEAVQSSTCDLPCCKWSCKILKVLPFTSGWSSTDFF